MTLLRTLLTLGLFLAVVAVLPAGEVSFRRDVMAVFSKAGCNSGACHGNQNGKGGFKLSLRGQDPDLDFLATTRDQLGRRVDLLDPERSLLLLKPSGRVPHEGGVRLRRGTTEFELLRGWLAAGARPSPADEAVLTRIEVTPVEQVLFEPANALQLRATAHFADGGSRDVTALAAYESSNLVVSVTTGGTVVRQSYGESTVLVRFLDQQVPARLVFRPASTDFVWDPPAAENFIDERLYARLRAQRMHSSPIASDSVFVRRAFLDAIGTLPTSDESRSFVADVLPDKRARLIDGLLARPEFADHWALKWSDILRNEEKVLDPRGVQFFHDWIRDSVATSKPLDQFVRELVSARGSTYAHPPANYYRANRDPATRGETTARLFLGVRLQCAQCHNHPYDRWTQDDYYSWAALFARVGYTIVENNRQDKLDLNEFNGEQLVEIHDSGELRNARTGQDAVPRFLGASPPTLDAKSDRLTLLAAWLTSPDNQRFAQAQTNFVWYHLLGRGLVEPIDDFRVTNPAVNPELLAQLASELVAHHFDLQHLVRTIMNSRTYQFSAEPNDTNREDDANFSRAIVRRLPAEKLLDAQCQVLGLPAQFSGYPRGMRAGQIPGVRSGRDRNKSDADRFLKTFGKPERLLACECERSNETTLAQALVLIGGDELTVRLAEPGNRLEQLAKSDLPLAEMVQELYWTALSRPPSAEELQAAADWLSASSDRLPALQDLAWSLLNAKEFMFRH